MAGLLDFLSGLPTQGVLAGDQPIQKKQTGFDRAVNRFVNPTSGVGKFADYLLAASGAPIGQALVGMQQGRKADEEAQLDREYKRAHIDSLRNPTAKATTAQLNARMLYPNDPEKQRQYVEQVTLKSAGGMPSTIQEWEYYNSLLPEDQQRFLEMKRAQKTYLQDVAGAPTVVTPGMVGQQPTQQPLSTPQAEIAAAANKAAATAEGAARAKAEVEHDVNAPKRQERYRQITETVDNTMASIDEALKEADLWNTGFVGAALSGIRGTNAYDLEKTLETIKANIGFDKLQMMRDASPTGGALGQVAIQELVALQASIASLDQGQRKEQLVENLGRVRKHYDAWKEAVKAASADGASAKKRYKYNPATGMVE